MAENESKTCWRCGTTKDRCEKFCGAINDRDNDDREALRAAVEAAA